VNDQLHAPTNLPPWTLHKRLDEPQSRSGCSGGEKNLCLAGSRTLVLRSPAYGLVSIMTETLSLTTEHDRAGILIARVILFKKFLWLVRIWRESVVADLTVGILSKYTGLEASMATECSEVLINQPVRMEWVFRVLQSMAIEAAGADSSKDFL
jgi:hypothetical protein